MTKEALYRALDSVSKPVLMGFLANFLANVGQPEQLPALLDKMRREDQIQQYNAMIKRYETLKAEWDSRPKRKRYTGKDEALFLKIQRLTNKIKRHPIYREQEAQDE